MLQRMSLQMARMRRRPADSHSLLAGVSLGIPTELPQLDLVRSGFASAERPLIKS